MANIFPEQLIVRRSTGGGCVAHGHDITFSLMIPRAEALSTVAPLLFYHTLHQAVAAALKDISIATHLAKPEETAESICCFTAPALHDLLWNGKKILGGAQRRHRGNLLYQGSLSLVSSQINATIFLHDLALHLAQEVSVIEEKPHWVQEAAALALKQYRSESWTKKR